jgi:hypothetical protein
MACYCMYPWLCACTASCKLIVGLVYASAEACLGGAVAEHTVLWAAMWAVAGCCAGELLLCAHLTQLTLLSSRTSVAAVASWWHPCLV